MSRVYAVIGLGYGDEGKGTIVDYLCGRTGAKLVVRHNGGPQAAHNVVTDDGRHHTFSQFGSGTLRGARTLLSRHVAVDPPAMEAEAVHLAELGVEDPLSRLSIDTECLVITPVHRGLNRLREISRGGARHGSCGVGHGEAVAHAIVRPLEALRVGDFLHRGALNRGSVYEKIRAQVDYGLQEAARFSASSVDPRDLGLTSSTVSFFAERSAQVLARVNAAHDVSVIEREFGAGRDVVFEGAQGMLLDEDYGFHPHTTWSRTDFRNVDEVLSRVGSRNECVRVGVTRSFATRHGAGPLVTEDEERRVIAGEHNGKHLWQGAFRTGSLDLVALRYAVEAAGSVDQIALTHVDMIDERCRRACRAYSFPGTGASTQGLTPPNPGDFVARERLTKLLSLARPEYESVRGLEHVVSLVEETCGAQARIFSSGPRARDKKERP